MYNRYVPQSDGSYQRNRIPDQRPDPPPEQPPHPTPRQEVPARQPPRPNEMGIGSFLRQILPKGFDTGDLIVVLLLLLMAADSQEDQNTALLTMALYLFL